MSDVQPTILELPLEFRYCVHRQFKGTFTPMVFDLMLKYELNQDDSGEEITEVMAQRQIRRCVRMWTNSALMVDVDSPFFTPLLKGQESGLNRKTIYDEVFYLVKRGGGFWYSHNQVPPVTVQEQHIVSYDVGNPLHGSMLDPANVAKFVSSLIEDTVAVTVRSCEIVSGMRDKQP